jgi:hypothetical protein
MEYHIAKDTDQNKEQDDHHIAPFVLCSKSHILLCTVIE